MRKGYAVRFVVQPDSPLNERATEEGIPVLPVRMRGEADFWAAFRLGRAMKHHDCRLVHFHDAHAVALGAAAPPGPGAPRFISAGRFSDQGQHPVAAQVHPGCGRDHRHFEGEEGARRFRHPATLIPSSRPGSTSPFHEVTSRDFLRGEFSFAPDDYLVGIVAALEDHKGHTYLIKATKIVKDQAPKIKLIVVGAGSLRMALDRQVRDLGVEDIVFFLGFRKDVPRILASLDLFVLSSHLEGLGTSLLDAMASRLPVVATETGGIPEVVINGRTGLLVPPKDPEALAQAILKLYRDRPLAARMASRGFDLVHDKFSAEGMAWKIIGLYERIARNKGVRLT
jgi:glycosyltransferase involved in cell wall biosynthesis